MEDSDLSWKHVVLYIVAMSLSAGLIFVGKSPGLAAVPCFLAWLIVNDKMPRGL